VALTVPTLIATFLIHRANEKRKTTALEEEKNEETKNNEELLNGENKKKSKVLVDSFTHKVWKKICIQESFKTIMLSDASSSSLPSLNGFRGMGVKNFKTKNFLV
jgi:hypothetical protein